MGTVLGIIAFIFIMKCVAELSEENDALRQEMRDREW